ncbi:unnamed protein product [Urochloa humidicola]
MEYLAADRRKRPARSEGEVSAKRVKNLDDKRTLFVKQQLHDFGECYDGDINREEPRKQLYSGIGTHGSQTSTCSNIALAHYNRTKGKSYTLNENLAMDSHCFELMVRSGDSLLSVWHVHVNFWARGSTGESELFFAELKGMDEPNETVAVVPLGHDDETIKAGSGEHFCKFCTGGWMVQ